MSWLWLLVIVAPATLVLCLRAAVRDPDRLRCLDDMPDPSWREIAAIERELRAMLTDALRELWRAGRKPAPAPMPMAPLGRHAAGLARVTLPSTQPGSLPRVRADGCPWKTGPMPVLTEADR